MTREELENFLMETLVHPLERERDAIEQKIAEKDREIEEERKAKDRERKAREKIGNENEVLRKDLQRTSEIRNI